MSFRPLRHWSLPRIFPSVVIACFVGFAIALTPQSQLIVFGAVIAAVAIIAAIFAEPVLGLALAMIVGPFQPLERITLQLPIDSGQVVLAITLLAYLIRALATRQSSIINHQSPITLALAAFIVVILLSFFPARDFTDWANECIKWIQILLICLIVANERDSRKRAILIAAILISAAGQAIYGIIQSDVRGFGPREFRVLGSETSFRAYGTFEQPNPFGGYMGLVWPLAAGVALWAWRRVLSSEFLVLSFKSGVLQALNNEFKTQNFADPRSEAKRTKLKTLNLALAIIATLVTVLCLIALNESGSRGALISAGAAAVTMVIVTMVIVLLKQPWKWIGAAFVITLALLAFDVMNAPASLDAQFQEFSDAESAFGLDVRAAHVTPITFSTIERLAHWQAAIRMMTENPWLGVGFGNYAAAYDQYRLLNWINSLGHAHNYYLNIFAETGLIGFLAYVGMWVTIIVVTIRTARDQLKTKNLELKTFLVIGILGAFVHLTVHNVFDNLYVANMHVLIGVYLGLIVVDLCPSRGTLAQH